MAKLQFNRDPYFDDFDEDNHFYQLLFQPKRAIQTRELNQMQSSLANQTERFANHIFKFGSMVTSGSIRYKNHSPYVRLKDLTPSGGAIDASNFINKKVRGKTSDLVAEVVFTTPKDDFDPATVFVNYTNTAIDGETAAFLNGEELEVLDSSGYAIYLATVRCPDCAEDADSDTISPTGFGSLFAIEPSAYYIHGKFIPIQFQMIVLDKYTTIPTYKIGFDIVQSIVSSDSDVSLNDNALGTPNFTAPGADRYKIDLTLSKKPLTDEDDENFVLLAKVDAGYLQEVLDKPQYSELMDTLARRTFDESGNYTVNPFTLNFKEHLKATTTSTDGWKELADGGDESMFVAAITPGKGYVRGREIETLSERIVPIEKARDSDTKRSSVVRPVHGNYILITLDAVSNFIPDTDMTDGFNPTDFEPINLYDGATSGGNATGDFIGRLRVKGIELHSGTAGTDAVYKMYIWDMAMEDGYAVSDIAGLYRTGGGGQTFAANIELDPIDSVGKVYQPDSNILLFPIPYKFTQTIRDVDNALVSNISVTVTKKMVGAVSSGGIVTFLAEGNETYLSFDSNKWIGGLQTSPGGNYDEFDLTQSVDTVSATQSQIAINVGTGEVGKNFSLIAEVMIIGTKEKQKVHDTKYLTNISGDVASFSLQTPDVWRVVSVTNTTLSTDVTANYTLDNGVRDNGYFHSTLTLKSGLTVPDAGDKLDIECEYFSHTGTGFYFSVDSYTPLINDPDIDFSYEDIPVYTDRKGDKYRLSDVLDFRPTVGDDNTFTGTNASGTYIPVDQSNIIFDIGFYLQRIDLLCLNELGEFIAVKGVPALEPVVPAPAENSMPIYKIYIDAYTFDVKRNIKQKYIDNRRYTMNDIGRIEKRVANLEYYVTFNLVEQLTADTNILDANGNDRFKNGFLVDSFKDFIASSTDNPEYSVSIDPVRGELRPSFNSNAIGVTLDETASDNYQITSKVATLPYTQVSWMDQPFATKTVSVNPYFVYDVQGSMMLVPESDVWKDVITQPDMVVDLDTGWEDLLDLTESSNVLGTVWDTWRTTNSQTNRIQNGRSATNDQTRTGINTTISNEINELGLGDNVTSVNIIPHIRPIPVQFAASNMKPRTKVYAFFNDVDVTEDCRPMNGSNSNDLVTDESGNIRGVFSIPNRADKRFFTGTRIFRLTNHATNSLDPDELTTSAEAQFFAGGLGETRRETVLSVSVPNVTENVVSDSRTVTSIRRDTSAVLRGAVPRSGLRRDPLAQSFVIANDTGVFITGCDIYFSAVPDSAANDVPVWFEIRNMVNGYPGTVIAPFSATSLKSNDVNVSDDGTTPTRFSFEAPVYLQPDEEYCMVVGSSSQEYRIYVSKLGGQTVGSNPVTVSTQPHLGSMFKSQNNATWTTEQYEDIKFNLYRAEFDITDPMELAWNNNSFGLKTALIDNPFETEDGSRNVRVYMKNHGLNASDKVKIELLQDTWYEVYLVSGNLVVGQGIQGGTNSGTAIIKALIHDGPDGSGNNVYRVQLAELKGWFDDAEQITGQIFYESFTNESVLSALGITPRPLVHNVAIGSFPTGIDNTFNGVPLLDISTPDHLVQAVDSMDSFVIQVDTAADADGRVGGSGAYAVGNVQVDSFELQGNYIDFNGEGAWSVSGVKHAAVGSVVTDYQAVGPIGFEPNNTRDMQFPMKIANEINEDMHLGSGNKSIVINAELTSDNSFISPIVNLDSIGFITITNRIDWNTCANYSISPLATNDGAALVCDPDDVAYTGNPRWIQETNNDAGTEGAKYIIKPVTLSNPATNMKIYMDVLNFLDTEISVYYRTLPSDLEASIESQAWISTGLDSDVISEHEKDFKEAEITIPNDPVATLVEFKAFQLKIVLRSKNTATPPRIKKFRAIAVT